MSYFGDDPEKYRGDDIVRMDSKGTKLPALHDLLEDHWATIGQYRYIWLPDDDLACSGDDIDRLFLACEQYELKLAQPSLSYDSFFGHLITLNNTSFEVRFTNFVEIMAPCFSIEALAAVRHTFGANLSGWGLDYVWPQMVGGEPHAVGIIDRVQIKHTRRIGGPIYRALNEKQTSLEDEMNRALEAHSASLYRHKIVEAVYRDGGRFSGGRSPTFLWRLVTGYLSLMSRRPRMARHLIRFAMTQFWRR